MEKRFIANDALLITTFYYLLSFFFSLSCIPVRLLCIRVQSEQRIKRKWREKKLFSFRTRCKLICKLNNVKSAITTKEQLVGGMFMKHCDLTHICLQSFRTKWKFSIQIQFHSISYDCYDICLLFSSFWFTLCTIHCICVCVCVSKLD